MNNADIMDAVQKGIEIMIFQTWRHSGHINYFNGEKLSFTADGKRYMLTLEQEADNGR